MEKINFVNKRSVFVFITLSLLFFVMNLIYPYSKYLVFSYFIKTSLDTFFLGLILILFFSFLTSLIVEYLFSKYHILHKKIFFVSLYVLFVLSYILTLAQTSYSLFSYIEMNSFFFTLINYILLSPILVISSFLINYIFSYYKQKQSTASGIGGITLSLFSMGCPSCGAFLYSLLGVGGLFFSLPFKGIELKILSLGLLIFAMKKISSNKEVCKSDTALPQTISQKHIKKSRAFFDTNDKYVSLITAGIFIVSLLIIFNQFQIYIIYSTLEGGKKPLLFFSSRADLSGVEVVDLSSTAETIAAVFPELKEAKSYEDVVNIMLPSGTPEYSDKLGGITFDDPVNSLAYLAKWYFVLKKEVQEKDPETWQRYLSLAAAPRGISCEFCCGVGPQGIDSKGNLRCGCQHNPALQAIALGLLKYTDYSDAEVLREVMRWKTLFFPKNMIALGLKVSQNDISQIKDLPGMVGGC